MRISTRCASTAGTNYEDWATTLWAISLSRAGSGTLVSRNAARLFSPTIVLATVIVARDHFWF